MRRGTGVEPVSGIITGTCLFEGVACSKFFEDAFFLLRDRSVCLIH